MIIQCIGFGSLWWRRPGPTRAHSAVFNTTAFGKKSRCWVEPGLLRFNENSRRFIQRYDDTLIGASFFSPGIERLGKLNRLLLHPRCSPQLPIDKYLVRLSSDIFGRINFGGDWRTGGVRLIARSARDTRQETLLLMNRDDLINTSLGTLDLTCLLKQSSPTNQR
jgi:hypothetical protein